jgi:hypothetical protein
MVKHEMDGKPIRLQHVRHELQGGGGTIYYFSF